MNAEVRELPLFPLNTVLFPAGPLPLRIFEPRYLDMISRCLREQTGFAVVLIGEGAEVESRDDFRGDRHRGAHRRFDRLEGGLLASAAIGRERVRIVRGLARAGRTQSRARARHRRGSDRRALPPDQAGLADVVRQ